MSSAERDDDPRPALTRRMAEVWQAQRPTELDVARARRRFALGRAAAIKRARVQPLAWAFAVVFGAGSVLAAGGLIVRPWLEGQAETRENSDQGRRAVVSSKRAARPERTEAREDLEASEVLAPPRLEVHGSDLRAPPEPVAAPEAARRAEAVPTEVKVAPAVDRTASGAWARAAEALRLGDGEAAHRALREVMAAGTKAERDAAALLEAQLWVQSGRFEQAAPRLRELAASGATATIRRQAGELLNRQPPTGQP